MNEVYYCGHCRRQQQPGSGIFCIACSDSCRTVSWYTDHESESDALRKFRHVNPGRA
ncbi:hypothetical protein ACWDSJ_02075 [Nocardia sp. NPDC003482]|uniref:hypothetical protein n=1 Tax=Nocardia sp. NPDC004068 TaxID=3364303 RepID=UPI0036CF0838